MRRESAEVSPRQTGAEWFALRRKSATPALRLSRLAPAPQFRQEPTQPLSQRPDFPLEPQTARGSQPSHAAIQVRTPNSKQLCCRDLSTTSEAMKRQAYREQIRFVPPPMHWPRAAEPTSTRGRCLPVHDRTCANLSSPSGARRCDSTAEGDFFCACAVEVKGTEAATTTNALRNRIFHCLPKMRRECDKFSVPID
jgi:hypothetical protein